MENTITQRVRDLIERSGLSISAFSKSINVPNSTLNQQLNGRNGKNIGVQIDVISSILSSYPGLSAEWLMRGNGDIRRIENEKQFKDDERNKALQNAELIEALRDQITSLKETNALLREKIERLETQKKYDAGYRELPVAAEEITYNTKGK